MSRSFTIKRDSVAAGNQSGLLREVVGHTGSEDEANSILRSLERLGSDASIGYYEMTPMSSKRRFVGAASVVWSVRAVRPDSDR
jgi:hypothetical protein